MTGWTVRRVPGKPVGRDEDRTVRIPLLLARDGTYVALVALELSPSDAELLHAQLCHTLAGQPPPYDAPDCRKSTHPTTVRWP